MSVVDDDVSNPELHRETAARKAAELALHASEKRFRSLIEKTSDAVALSSAEGKVLYMSPSISNILGWTPEELLGESLLDLVVPEDRGRAEAVLRELILEPSKGSYIQCRLRHRDGSFRWLESTGTNLLADPALNAIVCNLRDITASKAMHTRLLLADRMVSMGALAAGVAHEINNPLAATMATLVRLREDLRAVAAQLPAEAEARLQDLVSNAAEGAERVSAIVRDLKRFSRPEESACTVVDLERVIESAVRLAGGEIRPRARLVTDLGLVPVVHANEGRLCQVVLNLLVNAAQSIHEGRAEENEIRIEARTDSHGHAVIAVSDTGAGIAVDLLGGIFEPFFTTKAVGVGTGLGLSICHSIVTGMGGSIMVDSTVGRGTTVKVTLPPGVPSDLTEPAPPSKEPPVPPSRRGRVLIIDDEPLIARALSQTLSGSHEVMTSSSAHDALERIKRGERYDAILCDLMMPSMTGMDLYEELGRTFPDLARRMVFMTGGVFTRRAEEFLGRVINMTLDKPFNMAKLEVVISDLVQ